MRAVPVASLHFVLDIFPSAASDCLCPDQLSGTAPDSDLRRDLSLAGETAGGGSCISLCISKPAARENGLAHMDRVFCGVYRDDGGADIWKLHLVRQADPHRRALSDDECGSTVLSAPAYDRDPRYIQQFYEEPEKMLCTGGTG